LTKKKGFNLVIAPLYSIKTAFHVVLV